MTRRVKNLSSRIQAILLRRVATDWEAAYGQRPVLVESFVDRERFDGASYRAANWIELGRTRGRGRQDARHERSVSVKRVFAYPLERRFRDVGKGADGGQFLHPAFPKRNDCFDLGLLEHDLRNPDGVGIEGAPPWKVSGVLAKPSNQQLRDC